MFVVEVDKTGEFDQYLSNAPNVTPKEQVDSCAMSISVSSPYFWCYNQTMCFPQ